MIKATLSLDIHPSDLVHSIMLKAWLEKPLKHHRWNVESSHETVSSGGVQGLQNVESSHETVSSGGVQGLQNG